MKSKYLFGKILLTFVVLITVSCDRNRYFEHNIQIQDNKWVYNEAKVFSFELTDTNSLFNFYINTRNTNDYPFANLYVFVNTKFPNQQMARDTIELQLAYLNGEWLGSGKGEYKYNQFVLRNAMRFVQQGVYSFSLEQGMRMDTLVGISDIGIRLEYDQ